MSEGEDEVAVVVVQQQVDASTGMDHRVLEYHLIVLSKGDEGSELYGMTCKVIERGKVR